MGGPEREEGQAATTGSLDLSLLETRCRGRVWGLCCVGSVSCAQVTLALQREGSSGVCGAGSGGVSRG